MIFGLSGVALMSDSNLFNHTTSCVAIYVLSAMYSVSVVDKVTTGCFILSQLTAPPDMTKKIPIVVECRLSLSSAQSASKKT